MDQYGLDYFLGFKITLLLLWVLANFAFATLFVKGNSYRAAIFYSFELHLR